MPLGRPLYEHTRDTRIARLRYDVERLKRRLAPPPVGVGVTVETLFLDSFQDSDFPSVSSGLALEDGSQYLIVVEGTYSRWNEVLDVGTPEADAMFPSAGRGAFSTEVGCDAETIFAMPSDADPSNVIGHNVNAFLIDLGSGLAHVEPDDGSHATPAAGHLYKYTVTGQGGAATFAISDINPTPPPPGGTDNYGKLKITIQSLDGTTSGGGGGSGGGGTGSLVPPTIVPDEVDDVLRVGADGAPFWDDRIWRPVMALDPTSGNYLPVTSGDGDAVMTLY